SLRPPPDPPSFPTRRSSDLAGVVVVDVSDPANPREVARYDTYPANDDGGFHGNWGTIPPTPGGYVYASDIEGRLTVLRWRPGQRSEEHTSELQSRENLVCRL